MKKIILIFAFIMVVIQLSRVQAQNPIPLVNDPIIKKIIQPIQTFESIRSEADSFYIPLRALNEGNLTKGEKFYRRWDYYTQSRCMYPNAPIGGSVLGAEQYMADLNDYYVCNTGYSSSPWTSIGENPTPADLQDIGIIISIAIDPGNNNIIYAGSNTAGIWKTTNGGANWVNKTDILGIASLGINSIVIDPNNSNNILAGTGTRSYGWSWINPAGIGVIKSTDGGNTWATTNIASFPGDFLNIEAIKYYPSNSNIVYAIANKKIYKSINGGTTWTTIFTNPTSVIVSFIDLEFNISNPNIIYVSTNFRDYLSTATHGAQLFVSTDGGVSWGDRTPPNTFVPNVSACDAIAIDVTPADPTAIYITYTNGASPGGIQYLRKSTDNGNSWELINQSTHSGFGYWVNEFEVSNTNTSVFYLGDLQMNKSTDSGLTWNIISQYTPVAPAINSTHADIRALVQLPSLTEDCFVMGNDGGVAKTTNGGTTWLNINGDGLIITQFYAFGSFNSNENLVGGAQDNGTKFKNGSTNTWKSRVIGSDGGWTEVDYANDNIVYASSYDFISKSKTGGSNGYQGIGNPGASVVLGRRFHIDPSNHNHLWWGAKDLYVYNEPTNTWSLKYAPPATWIDNASNVRQVGSISAINVAPSNGNIIYIAYWGPTWGLERRYKLLKTTNGGTTWSDISNTFPAYDWTYITDFEVDPINPNRVWASCAGYWQGTPVSQGANRVIFSENGGQTWVDASIGLPPFPVNCLTYQNGTDDVIYAGTDAGVYRWNKALHTWECFNNGLPATIITKIEVNNCKNKIIVSTFGRGIWEAPLPPAPSFHITSSQTWDASSNYSFNTDVIIDPGVTLTIIGTVRFVESKYLIVNPGGRLIVDGGILTSGCGGDIWQGIEVQGNPNQMQNNPQYQGYVELKNGATIENAVIGVHCVLNGYIPAKNNVTYYSSGGIVVANGAIFRNNKTAINIERYASAYGLSYYVSNINGCTFEYPNLIPNADVETPTYIKLTGVKGVNISQNNFNGNINNLYYHRGIGIEAHDATFKSNSPAGVNPLPNVFTNLSYGIACYNTSTLAKPEILLSTFTDCWRAIYLSTVADAKVINNTINYKSQSTDPLAKAYGIYLDNCNDYQVEGNLLSSSSKVMSEYPENGIVVNNSGTTTNQIYRNSFTQIQVPVNAQNINRLPDGSIGLQLLCNNINECTVNDMVVTYDASQLYPNNCGIKTNQGRYIDPKVPAGNLFTKGGKVYKNYINATPNIVYYAHYSNDLITYQTNPHYLIPRILAVNSNMSNQNTVIQWTPERWVGTDCKDLTGLPGGGKSLNDVEGLKEQIDVLQPKIDSANTVLVQKMDHGNTTTLINRIATATPANYQTLYNDLRNYSPYLSEEVLLAVIHKQGFPSNMLVNLMLVNTHVAKTPLLMEALQQKQPPLPSGQIKQIANKINVFSVMEIDRMKISNMLTQRDCAYNTVESYYAHDSLVSSNDSLGEMLVRDPRLSAKYGLVYHYLANNDSTNADLLANQIPQLFSLDAQAQLEYNHYKQLYDLKRSLQREGKNFMDLSEAQQQMLINAINNPSMSTGKMNDLNALRQVAGMIVGNTKGKTLTINYNEPIIDPIENKEKNFDNTDVTGNEALLMEVLMDKVLMEQNNLQLYPNPASNMVNVLYNISSDAGKVSIEINDVTGKIISTYMVDKNSSQMIINTQSLNKGIYYVMLKVDNKSMKVEKLVIQ